MEQEKQTKSTITKDMQEYEFKIRFLGNELFAIALTNSSTSNKWVIVALISMFTVLTILGAYGEKFVAMYQGLVG